MKLLNKFLYICYFIMLSTSGMDKLKTRKEILAQAWESLKNEQESLRAIENLIEKLEQSDSNDEKVQTNLQEVLKMHKDRRAWTTFVFEARDQEYQQLVERAQRFINSSSLSSSSSSSSVSANLSPRENSSTIPKSNSTSPVLPRSRSGSIGRALSVKFLPGVLRKSTDG